MSLTRTVLFAAALLAPIQSARGATITITRLDCARIVRHMPVPDVAYRPGVDVRGRPVTPADFAAGPTVALPRELKIPLTIDLHDRLGIPADPTLFEAETRIGTVVYRDGEAWLDGRKLSSDGAAGLAKACRERLDPKH